jgi:NitT/TauT family transport system substrate-binding protein
LAIIFRPRSNEGIWGPLWGEVTREAPSPKGSVEEFAMRRWILVLGVLFLSSASSLAADKFNFTPGWLFYGRDVGFFASVEKGYYAREGIDLTIVPGKGASDAVSRVAAGADRFAVAGLGAVVVGRAQKVPVKVVAMYHDKPLDVVYALRGSGIEKPKDLEGKNIGTTAKDAPTMLFPAVAEANGMDLNKIKWTYMAPPAKIPSLLAGRVDATITFHNSYPALLAGAKKVGKEVVVLLYADWGLDIYSAGVIAKDEDLLKNKDLVGRFLRATYEGNAWAVDHPEEANQLFIKRNPTLNAEIALAEWKITIDHMMTPLARKNGLGYMDREKMKRTIEVLAKSLEVKPVPVDEFYTGEFLPKVLPQAAMK